MNRPATLALATAALGAVALVPGVAAADPVPFDWHTLPYGQGALYGSDNAAQGDSDYFSVAPGTVITVPDTAYVDDPLTTDDDDVSTLPQDLEVYVSTDTYTPGLWMECSLVTPTAASMGWSNCGTGQIEASGAGTASTFTVPDDGANYVVWVANWGLLDVDAQDYAYGVGDVVPVIDPFSLFSVAPVHLPDY